MASERACRPPLGPGGSRTPVTPRRLAHTALPTAKGRGQQPWHNTTSLPQTRSRRRGVWGRWRSSYQGTDHPRAPEVCKAYLTFEPGSKPLDRQTTRVEGSPRVTAFDRALLQEAHSITRFLSPYRSCTCLDLSIGSFPTSNGVGCARSRAMTASKLSSFPIGPLSLRRSVPSSLNAGWLSRSRFFFISNAPQSGAASSMSSTSSKPFT